MKKAIEETLGEILNYFDLVRGVGHTTAVIRGAQNVDQTVIICADSRSAADVKNQCNHNVAQTTLDAVERGSLRGRRLPVVLDNHALRELIWSALLRISELKQEVEIGNQRLETAKDGIRELQKIYEAEVEKKVQHIVAKYDKETAELRRQMADKIREAYSNLSVEQLAKRIVEIEQQESQQCETSADSVDCWCWIASKE